MFMSRQHAEVFFCKHFHALVYIH